VGTLFIYPECIDGLVLRQAQHSKPSRGAHSLTCRFPA